MKDLFLTICEILRVAQNDNAKQKFIQTKVAAIKLQGFNPKLDNKKFKEDE